MLVVSKARATSARDTGFVSQALLDRYRHVIDPITIARVRTGGASGGEDIQVERAGSVCYCHGCRVLDQGVVLY